jgi:hypothetical protein
METTIIDNELLPAIAELIEKIIVYANQKALR